VVRPATPFAALTIAWFLAAPAVAALPRPPADLPAGRDELGTAFMESWIALRREVDTLAHLPAHPAMLEAWLGHAPRFLLRDILALAAEPRVVAAAARALARAGQAEDFGLLADLEQRHGDGLLGEEIRAARIRAGDGAALALAQRHLSDPRAAVRERAALALALAGRREGLAALREDVARRSGASPIAVRFLGLVGAPADASRLGAAGSGGAMAKATLAARGEIALRRAFPEHHRALLARDGASVRLRVKGGLYDSWLGAVHGALEGGARTGGAVLAHVESLRKQATGDDGEVVRRNLAALTEFWQQVDARIAATGSEPRWPSGMAPARALILARRRADDPPARQADRISALFAACSWLGEALAHRGFVPLRAEAHAITPGGDRALDGNPATAAYLPPGGSLLLELPAGSRPADLRIANSCPDGPGPRLRRIAVTRYREGDRETVESALEGATRYFQTVHLGGKPAERLEIRALEIEGDGPACLAEIRVR
jgi:hypothetical protein